MLTISHNFSEVQTDEIINKFTPCMSISDLSQLLTDCFDKWLAKINYYKLLDDNDIYVHSSDNEFIFNNTTKKIYMKKKQRRLFCLVTDDQSKVNSDTKCETFIDPFGKIHVDVTQVYNKYQIFCRTLTGATITLCVAYNNTVAEMKQMICDKEGILPDQQRIIYGGNQLVDHMYLMNYEIQRESTVNLILRLRGGMHHISSSHNDYRTTNSTNTSKRIVKCATQRATRSVTVDLGANKKISIMIETINNYCTRDNFISAILCACACACNFD